MGFLDDAIREHLELKRLHGAEAEELSRLEQEAFSPPSRPGDPDFGPEPGTGDEPEQVAAELFEQGADAPEREEPGAMSGTELGRVEHSGLEDTIAHPVTEEGDAAAAPPEAPESAIFDADADLDLDLDLDLEDELGNESPPAPRPAEPKEVDDDFLAGADLDSAFDLDPPAPAVEPAPLPGESPPTGEAPAPMTPAAEEEEPAAAEGSEPEGDDLLEETPEFLKDAPDGESLWFEQGKPEDFDFDD